MFRMPVHERKPRKYFTSNPGSYLIRILPILICMPVFFWPKIGNSTANPAFYLATDRTFTSRETPYVNLEAPGHADVEFRIYRIRDPREFFLKRVRSRIIEQSDPIAMGNPFALLQDSLQTFRTDLIQIARQELNTKNRKHLRRALAAPLGLTTSSGTAGPLATPGLRTEHEYLRSFRVPTSNDHWSYRRVPVPVDGNGIFLIEAVYGSHMAATVLVRSELTFLTKQSDRGTVVYSADSLTGLPATDVSVELFHSETGARLGGGKTNSQGIFRHAGNPPAQTLVFVHKKSEYAVSDPNFFSSSFYGKGGPRVLLYTDRPIYRPGDRVYFKAIARTFSGTGGYKPLGGSARVSVADDQGNVVISNLAIPITTTTGTADGQFELPDNENLSLGTYNLILTTGNRSFSAEFRVDAYRKPKFRVRVSTPKRIYGKSDSIPIRVSAGYYYGKALADASANVRVFRTPRYDYSPVGALNFASASKYLGSTGGASQRELVLDQSSELNANGLLELSLSPENVDHDYDYSVLASITTEDSTITGSTAFAVNRSSFYMRVLRENQVYTPGETAEVTVQLIAYDSTLTPEQRKSLLENRPVEAELASRGFIQISREAERKRIKTLTARTDASGRAKLSFQVPAAGHYVLDFTAEANDGSETEATATLWSSGRTDTINIAAKDVKLTAGKDLYQVGETAEILVLSPVADASMFLSLEGSDLLHQETIQLKGNTLRYRVKITPAMSPNFVFSAALFHAGETYKSEIKIVAPPIQKFLNVSVKPDQTVYRPGDTVELTVVTSDSKGRGRAAEVSLGVVDMALYQLQNDPTPNLARFFYHPRRNNVATTLSSAYRFFGYSEEKRLQLALNRKPGPAALTAIKADLNERRNFKDQTYWNAKIKTDATGKARVKFVLADNLTEWKITARAITPDTRIGETTTTFIARKDLQIQAGIPPYLIEDREQTIAASISNLTKSKRKIEIRASAENGSIQGESTHTLELEPGEQSPVYFSVRTGKGQDASNKRSQMKIRLEASSDELRDVSEHQVLLKPFGLQRSVRARFAFAADANIDSSEDSDSNKQSDEATLKLPAKHARSVLNIRITPAGGAAVRQSLAYLADYPHGCIEQTMSRFVPLLAAKQAGFISPRLSRELPQMVQAGLTRIRQFQRGDGGFGWFSPDSASDPMMTAYVYRALALGKTLGYEFETRLLDRSRAFLYSTLSTGDLTPFQRAYLLFALSEGAPVEQSMVDGVFKTAYANKQTDYGRTLIALVLLRHKRGAQSREIIEALIKSTDLAKDDRGQEFTSPARMEVYGRWDEDSVEFTAALLRAAVRMKLSPEIQNNLAATLLRNRTSDGIAWKNSRDTASAVLALTEQLKESRALAKDSELNIQLNGKPLKHLRLTAKEIESGRLSLIMPNAPLNSGKNLLRITKSSGSAIYVQAYIDFFDQSQSFAAASEGMKVNRAYSVVAVERDDRGDLDITTSNSTEFRQGDLVMVSMRVTNSSSSRGYVQITDAIPPGFSFVANDQEYYANDRKREYESRQVYDDRAVFFAGDRDANLTIRYFLRANLPGAYNALPAKAAFMYYPENYGSTTDQRLTIAKR